MSRESVMAAPVSFSICYAARSPPRDTSACCPQAEQAVCDQYIPNGLGAKFQWRTLSEERSRSPPKILPGHCFSAPWNFKVEYPPFLAAFRISNIVIDEEELAGRVHE